MVGAELNAASAGSSATHRSQIWTIFSVENSTRRRLEAATFEDLTVGGGRRSWRPSRTGLDPTLDARYAQQGPERTQ
jgi:hypothetical protein